MKLSDQVKFDQKIFGMELISQNRIVIAFESLLRVFEIKNNSLD